MKIFIPDDVKNEEVVGYVKGIYATLDTQHATELHVGRHSRAVSLKIPFAGPDTAFWECLGSHFLPSK